MHTMTNMTTIETLTRRQVRALRDEALVCHTPDLLTSDLCTVYLSGVDSDGTGLVLGTPITVQDAAVAIVDTLRAAEAAR